MLVYSILTGSVETWHRIKVVAFILSLAKYLLRSVSELCTQDYHKHCMQTEQPGLVSWVDLLSPWCCISPSHFTYKTQAER